MVRGRVRARREQRVRRMVRELVLRYPLLLGTSLLRIEERFACAKAVRAPWRAYLTILRRPAAAHQRWLAGLAEGEAQAALVAARQVEAEAAAVAAAAAQAVAAAGARAGRERKELELQDVQEEGVMMRTLVKALLAPKSRSASASAPASAPVEGGRRLRSMGVAKPKKQPAPAPVRP
ncbi:hypothetical protein B484DRAFT_442567 [Ochromonadaceae sp. CCMP2298]|nr:hypothetical protein B484DRAFT_442567 [Ochromonadaceae sp. CCMP2298]